MLASRGRSRAPNNEREPIGIVISDGGPAEFLPRLAAFVWGPVPDDVDGPLPDLELAGAA